MNIEHRTSNISISDYKLLFRMLLLAFIFVGQTALAGELSTDSPWEITADKMSRFDYPSSIIAEGNVVLIKKHEGSTMTIFSEEDGVVSEETRPKKPLTITGDWIRLDPVLNLVKVRGNAVLDSDDEHVTADSANLSLDDHTGTLENATIYFPQRHLFLAGEHVEKTGELTYHLEDGWVTKCDPEDGKAPPWSFSWSTGDISYEGFAHFLNATLRVKNVPVVYSPYFAFSTNTKRKTGLLLPEWSQGGRDGSGLLVPLFVNLSPSSDLTLYAGGYSERGVVAGTEFRYVNAENSKATLAMSYLKDSLEDSAADDYKSDGIYRAEENRWWIRGKIDHDFGFMQGKLDLDLVSDRDYLQEFSDGMIGFEQSDRQFKQTFGRGFDSETTYVRSNTAQLNKLWANMSLNGEMRLINDPTDIPSTYHRWTLPKIDFAGRLPVLKKQVGSTGLHEFLEDTDFTWGSTYAFFLQENDLGGHLVDMTPKLTAPIRLIPYLETTASIGLRKTFYKVDDHIKAGYDSSVYSRTMYDFSLSTSTIFMRDFFFASPSFKRLTHMIRPSVSYNYTPSKNQLGMPDFVGTVAAVNSVSYGFKNDFDLFGLLADGTASTRKFGTFYVTQSYDIREERKDVTGTERREPFSDIFFELSVNPLEQLAFTYETDWNVYGRGITKYHLTSRYSNSRKDKFAFEYRYDVYQAVNQLNMSALINLTENLWTSGNIVHSLYADEISDATLTMFYDPGCWTLEFKAIITPDDDYSFQLIVALEDVGEILGINQTLYSQDTGGVSFNE